MTGRRARRAVALGAVVASVGMLGVGAASWVGAGTGSADIVVRKILGPEAPSDAIFTITVSCVGLADQPLQYEAPLGGVQIANVPDMYQGSCTITETATAGGTPSYACSGFSPVSECETADGPDPTVLSIDDPGPGIAAEVNVTNSFPPGSSEPVIDPALALEAVPAFTG